MIVVSMGSLTSATWNEAMPARIVEQMIEGGVDLMPRNHIGLACAGVDCSLEIWRPPLLSKA